MTIWIDDLPVWISRGCNALKYPFASLVLIIWVLCIGSCSSDRPRIGDWYERQQGKKTNIQINYLGTGHEITENARGKGYRYISGAGEYAEENCFAYEDSQQVLWEKIHFLVIEPTDNLRAGYKKLQGNP